MQPKSEGVLESSLYVNDVAGSARFYEKIFGFQVISDFGERGCALKAGMRQVLLLFESAAIARVFLIAESMRKSGRAIRLSLHAFGSH